MYAAEKIMTASKIYTSDLNNRTMTHYVIITY